MRCSLRIENGRRPRFVLDFHQRTGVCRLVERIREHERKRLPCIVDAIVLHGQIALAVRMQVAPRLGHRLHARHVSVREHGHYTRRAFGNRGIDGDRSPVRERAVDDRAVQCSGKRHVAGVLRSPRDLAAPIEAR